MLVSPLMRVLNTSDLRPLLDVPEPKGPIVANARYDLHVSDFVTKPAVAQIESAMYPSIMCEHNVQSTG